MALHATRVCLIRCKNEALKKLHHLGLQRSENRQVTLLISPRRLMC